MKLIYEYHIRDIIKDRQVSPRIQTTKDLSKTFAKLLIQEKSIQPPNY